MLLTTYLTSGIYCISYCTWYTYQSCYFIVYRPIEDEEPSDTDEVEDGISLLDVDSDDDE